MLKVVSDGLEGILKGMTKAKEKSSWSGELGVYVKMLKELKGDE